MANRPSAETVHTVGTDAVSPPQGTSDDGDAKPEADGAPNQPTGGDSAEAAAQAPQQKPGEIGGRDGPEPTRYGDWEVKGRCVDF